MAKQTFRSIQTKPEPFWTPLPIQLHLAQSIKVWSLTPVHGSPQKHDAGKIKKKQREWVYIYKPTSKENAD